jgi:hypothetical protein
MTAPNSGTAPPAFDTPTGQVRLLTGDTNPTDVDTATDMGTYLWYSDEEIQALLDLKNDSPQRTAIFILRMVSLTPAMQLKKWSSADLSVDGPAITRALRETIADIENGLGEEAGADAADFFALVNTGTVMGQPAFYPETPIQYNGVDLDPTLPMVL